MHTARAAAAGCVSSPHVWLRGGTASRLHCTYTIVARPVRVPSYRCRKSQSSVVNMSLVTTTSECVGDSARHSARDECCFAASDGSAYADGVGAVGVVAGGERVALAVFARCGWMAVLGYAIVRVGECGGRRGSVGWVEVSVVVSVVVGVGVVVVVFVLVVVVVV